MAVTSDGSGRKFIVDQTGLIHIIDASGNMAAKPFLGISDRLVRLNSNYDERGLLGLAFHRSFSQSGRFFVYYTAELREGAPKGWNCTNRLSEFKAYPGTNEADPSSEQILMEIDKPQSNHNGGHVCFGPDGFLYVPVGDGGGADDRDTGHTPLIGNAQDLNKLLGKILRIDVDSKGDGKNYDIPRDNPFYHSDGLPEIFAYGVRNPYHIAFDSGGERKLFAGDAGQNRWERVCVIERGRNYGWNLKEGTHCFNPEDDMHAYVGGPAKGYRGERLEDPIIEYGNLANRPLGFGGVVIGGYVYRGNAMPQFQGHYIFGDWSGSSDSPDGLIMIASPPPGGTSMWPYDVLSVGGGEQGGIGEYILAFGQDSENELYMLTSEDSGPRGNSGKVFKLVPR